jgi:hypothetical protein
LLKNGFLKCFEEQNSAYQLQKKAFELLKEDLKNKKTDSIKHELKLKSAYKTIEILNKEKELFKCVFFIFFIFAVLSNQKLVST